MTRSSITITHGIIASFGLALTVAPACNSDEPGLDLDAEEHDDAEEPDEDVEVSLPELSRYMRTEAQAQGTHRMRINLADDAQYEFVRARFRAAGLDPLTAPELLGSLEREREAALDEQGYRAGSDRCTVFISPIELKPGKYQSRATSTCFNGATYSFVDNHLYTEDFAPIGFNYFDDEWSTSVANVEAQGHPDHSQGVWSDSLTYVVTDAGFEYYYAFSNVIHNHMFPGARPRSADEIGEITASPDVSAAIADPVATDPTDKSGDGNVLICLERSTTDSNCDYLHSPVAGDPCTGDILCAPDEANTIEIWPRPYDDSQIYFPIGFTVATALNYAPTVEITLAEAHLVLTAPGDVTDPGGDCYADITQAFTDASNGLVVPSPYARVIEGPGLNPFIPRAYVQVEPFALGVGAGLWADHCVDHRADTHLIVNFEVRDTATDFVAGHLVDSEATPFTFNQLQIAWGCLPPGTKVTMADGSLLPIEEVKAGQRVLSEDGRALTVTDVMVGTDDDGTMVIEDELGHVVKMTLTHPVPTRNRGVVQARDLQPDDRIMTEAGPAAIVSIERIEYEGAVYNLQLGTPEELELVDADDTTMFAGGILVGDVRMQDAAKRAHDKEVLRERELTGLPETFPVDYLLRQGRRALSRMSALD